jgi:hypothetical protein
MTSGGVADQASGGSADWAQAGGWPALRGPGPSRLVGAASKCRSRRCHTVAGSLQCMRLGDDKFGWTYAQGYNCHPVPLC